MSFLLAENKVSFRSVVLIPSVAAYLSGDFNEVDPHGLAHEGERPGCPQVALDNHAVGALGDELHVERTRDIQPLRHGLRRVLFDHKKNRHAFVLKYFVFTRAAFACVMELFR